MAIRYSRLSSISLMFLLLPLAGCLSSFSRAVASGDVEKARAMIAAGQDVNKRSSGSTPLIEAASWGQVESVKLLLASGAAVDAKDMSGRTALSYAEERGYDAISRILRDAGGSGKADAKWAGSSVPQWASHKAGGGGVRRTPRLTGAAAADAGPESPEPVFVSDIDVPAATGRSRPEDFALVIGVGRYKSLPEADYAERDSAVMKKHLVALGFPPRNVISLEGPDATRSGIQGYVEEWLPKNVKPGSTVFFYYSGHGAPDVKTGEAYLVPWDGNPRFLKTSAYSTRQLYASLAKLPAKRVIVALDACFSGAGGRSVLPQGARPLVSKIDDLRAPEGITVFAAASGDEITASLEEKGHGLFTYFFLKGLSEGKRSTRELYDYLKPHVKDEALRQNREQTPVFFGPDGPF